MARSSRVASTGSRAPADEPGGSAIGRLAKLFGRGDAAVGNAAGPAAPPTPQAAPGDALVPGGRQARPARVLVAVVVGLDVAALERILAVVSTRSDRAEGAVETLCLTDRADFELFRSRSLPFEYLPPAPLQERFAPDLDWDLYLLRRLARLRRKWNPVRIVAFGPDAQALIAQWRVSPFEDDSIKDLIRAPQATAELSDIATD